MDATVSKKKRMDDLDLVAGIMMLVMMYGHCVQWAYYTDWNVYVHIKELFFFFMAWFFFKAGMFHNVQRTVGEVFQQGIKRLIVPFVVFTLIGHMVNCVLLTVEGNINLWTVVKEPIWNVLYEGSASANKPLWFLLSLFLARCLFAIVYRYTHRCELLLMGGVIAMLLNYFQVDAPLYVANVSLGVSFYTCGYMMKRAQYGRKQMMVSLLLYVAVLCIIPSMVNFRTNYIMFGNYAVFLFSSLAAIVLFNNAARYVCKYTTLLNTIGRESMYYLCVHWMIILVATTMMNLSGYEFTHMERFCVYAVACILLLAAMRPLFLCGKMREILGIK